MVKVLLAVVGIALLFVPTYSALQLWRGRWKWTGQEEKDAGILSQIRCIPGHRNNLSIYHILDVYEHDPENSYFLLNVVPALNFSDVVLYNLNVHKTDRFLNPNGIIITRNFLYHEENNNLVFQQNSTEFTDCPEIRVSFRVSILSPLKLLKTATVAGYTGESRRWFKRVL
ncbi:hypothetical protein BV898_02310 [Hypsibius exemplaris]|uniref:Uncharacterized protein n=1 Tax=Hypsibius exemplaris TaxID=2072580 RepID=A0A1W0X8Y0_HYPEX|nr:hypothetical protein BV898_02310 [Hypsibius exemplaris]